MIALKKIASPYRLTAITFILYGLNPVQSILAQSVTTIAQEQFNKFNSVKGGWCAADATISLLLPDGKTLWLFGDTFIGRKSGEFSINPQTVKMINNSAILQDGETMTSVFGGTLANPVSLIPGIGNDIFWPEHATIEGDTLKVFAIQIIFADNGTPGFNFRTGRTYLAKFTYPQLDFIGNNPLEFITDTTMRFGVQVLKRDDYTYIFGVKDTTAGGFTYPIPMLARVNGPVNEPWEFYSGNNTWSLNCKEAVSIGDRPMPESFYVYEKDDKFYLIMHEIWTVGKLYILEADHITGPWNRASSGGIEKLFAVVEPETNIFTYNLFAHPQFQNDDKLLISFNVNATNISSIYSDTRNYRARFFWLSIDNAMSVWTPDTLNIFNDYTDITEISSTDEQVFEQRGDQLYIKNIEIASILNIYNINGQILYKSKVKPYQNIDLSKFSDGILLLQLISNNRILTKKIVH